MFTADSVAFLKDFAANNDRSWFTTEKRRYEAALKAPAKAFSAALEMRRGGAAVRAKIFRIDRDLRFSKDKTPYNTHLHISVFDGEGPAAWMVGLEIERLVVGYGCLGFDADRLSRWRDAVASNAGAQPTGLLADCEAAGIRLDSPALKRVPTPFGADHPQAALLRRKGLALWDDRLPQQTLFGEGAAERIADSLRPFEPLRGWMQSVFSEP